MWSVVASFCLLVAFRPRSVCGAPSLYGGLELDDECQQSIGEGCALNALQISASTKASVVEVAGPSLASQWCADFKLIFASDDMTAYGRMCYDSVGDRYLIDPFNHTGIILSADAPSLGYNTIAHINYALAGKSWSKCSFSLKPDGYGDPLSWLRRATPSDQYNNHAKQCSMWSANVSFPLPGVATGNALQFISLNATSASACIGDDNVPREFVIGDLGVGEERHYWLTNITVGPSAVDADVHRLQKLCAEDVADLKQVCPGGRSAQLSVFRIHGAAEELQMADRNCADAAGALHILCRDQDIVNASMTNALITEWSLTVNTSWGVYRKCWFRNGHNFCEGTGDAVGRASQKDPQGRHCSEQEGNWFSLPGSGECEEGATVGSNGCTWRLSRRLRTADASCVAKQVCPFFRNLGIAEKNALLRKIEGIAEKNGTAAEIASLQAKAAQKLKAAMGSGDGSCPEREP